MIIGEQRIGTDLARANSLDQIEVLRITNRQGLEQHILHKAEDNRIGGTAETCAAVYNNLMRRWTDATERTLAGLRIGSRS